MQYFGCNCWLLCPQIGYSAAHLFYVGQAVVAAELLTLTGSTDTLIDICHVH